MNRKYKNLFLLAVMLLFAHTAIIAQPYLKIPEAKRVVEIQGVYVDDIGKYDTAQFRLANDIIFRTIRDDAPNRTLGDGTVYVLKRNNVYVCASTIDQQFLDIYIKGEDGDGRMPLVLHNNPPGTGAQGQPFIRAQQNTYFENFEFDARNPDNSYGNRALDFRGPGARVIIKGCRFTDDRGGGITIEAAGLNLKLYVYDCLIGNQGHYRSSGGNGRAVDIRLPSGGNLDSVVFINNTIYNLTDRVVRSMGDITNYMKFDHNTIINNQGVHGSIQLGNAKEAVITNNIFANPLTLGNRKSTINNARGEQSQEPNDKTLPDAAFAIVTHNGLKGRLTEGDIIGITMRNNNIFFEQEFLDLFAAHPEIFDSPTVRVASDAVYTYLSGDPAKMSFTENLPFDYNDSEAGNLGKVSSYKDLVEVTKTFIDDPNAVIYPENWSLIYPQEWNAAYPTTTASYTAADGGYPLGDLNWFPDDKAKWMASASKTIAYSNKASGIEINKAYPNPFLSKATVSYSILFDQAVEIGVYNFMGQKVGTIKGGNMKQGSYDIIWDGKGNNGNILPAGIYYFMISGASGQAGTKLVKK